MNKLLDHIAALIGTENLFTDAASLAAYSATASYCGSNSRQGLPVAVARPRHPAQLARMLAFCSEEKIPVAIRGQGTRPIPRAEYEGKILLATTGLERIYELSESDRAVHLQGGVASRALQAALAAKNLFCPLGAFGTVGGAIAVNPSTCQALKYGCLSNFVTSLDLTLGNGERMHASLAASAPGDFQGLPQLAGLFCGSKGQFGVITSCALRLLPAPEARILHAWQFDNLESAAVAAQSVLASYLNPVRLEIYDGVCAQALGLGAKPALICEYAGSRSDVEDSRNACSKIFAAEEEIHMEGKATHALLPLLYKDRGKFNLASASCLPAKLGDLLSVIRNLAAELRLELAVFCDAAVANVQLGIFGANAAEFENRLFTAELMLNEALESEADAALSRQEWLAARSAGVAESLKAIFDPAYILNVVQGQRQ